MLRQVIFISSYTLICDLFCPQTIAFYHIIDTFSFVSHIKFKSQYERCFICFKLRALLYVPYPLRAQANMALNNFLSLNKLCLAVISSKHRFVNNLLKHTKHVMVVFLCSSCSIYLFLEYQIFRGLFEIIAEKLDEEKSTSAILNIFEVSSHFRRNFIWHLGSTQNILKYNNKQMKKIVK